ncbi:MULTISPECIES: hypothetical protein [unclassified Streptomyces]|uniref:hypothetical protein n=1 Tax=unclassified Streptomyces TaxID=2593676 RepID=UPI00081D4B6B|nr:MULTISPECIES: hypothetical protein [unclassified Streptomyces]SCF77933.1 hypothetical protein GA0115259_102446 [Streptomyces sp. MnatMP-M17]
MSSPTPSLPTPRSKRLAGSPAVRRDSQWWLVSSAGSVLATDPVFTGELDHFATALAAADQAVAELLDEQHDSPAPHPRGQR